jgi:hypothetical protein
MRHQGFLNFLLFVTETRQFHKFIILTMMLPFTHDVNSEWRGNRYPLREPPQKSFPLRFSDLQRFESQSITTQLRLLATIGNKPGL